MYYRNETVLMTQRKVANSQVIEFETAECVYCGCDVFIDDEKPNVEELPKGVNVVIGGGNNISANKNKGIQNDYRIPEIVTKWFTTEHKKTTIDQQYMCPPCAESVYGFDMKNKR